MSKAIGFEPTRNTIKAMGARRVAAATVLVKPCPFCGGTPEMWTWHGGGPRKRMILCRSDDCYVSPMVSGETPTAAARRWNARTAASLPQQITG